ncbi:LysR family transcriptional regulator [Brevibacterium sp. 1718]|uniref:LysR family transcriptional regulator n=1 Tax=Brevibacterium sp. 1718 TaxID=3413510 RepID=UPI003DA90E50
MAEPSLKRLQYFIALAEHGKFQLAADAVNISQPALSAELKRLEDFVGKPLFNRSPVTKLTAAGEALLPYAKSAVGAAHRFDEYAAAVNTGAPTSISIGTVATFLHRGLPQTITDFSAAHPDILVTTEEATSAAQSDMLLGHDIDIACGHMPLQHPGVVCTPAARESFWLCAPAGSPITTIAEAVDSPFVIFRKSASPIYHDTVVGICRTHGFEPQIHHRTASWSAAVEMVAHGLGVSLVPSPVARSYHGDERLIFTRVGTRPNAPQAWITVRREDQSTLIGDLALDLVIASESLADPVAD